MALKLSLQSKSLDERVSHMIKPLKACCSLVSDLPVQDVSGDVDSSHGLTTKHKLEFGLEDPGVKAQMTFTLFSLRISCEDVENIQIM